VSGSLGGTIIAEQQQQPDFEGVSMGVIGDAWAVRLLNYATHNGKIGYPDVATAYANKSKLEALFGPGIWDAIRGKDVIDFGCGPGAEAVELAERGARRVIGLDLRQKWLRIAGELAEARGVADRCVFAREWHEPADVILSLDSFEHFADPAAILQIMHTLLRPSGCVLASFGPTWYHPLGGHFFSPFPYAHLLFSERALIRWRSLYKTDGGQSFNECGLNKMTIRRFEKLVAESPFRMAEFEAVPIKRLRPVASRLTREFTTAIVRCKLLPR
jgi:SAM-dependent methyltransferase